MIGSIDRERLREVDPQALRYIEALEATDEEHLAEVGRMRDENVRVWERLRERCKHCAEAAEILEG